MAPFQREAMKAYTSTDWLTAAFTDENLFQNVIDQINFPIFVIDPDDNHRFCFVNTKVCEHYGRSREELLRMRIPDWDPMFTYERCDEFWQLLKQIKKNTFETMHRTFDGRIIQVEITAAYLRLGAKEYIVGFIENIEERKQAEERQRDSHKFRDQIISVLSHDLRSPLGSVKGFAQLLREEEDLSPSGIDYITRVENAADRMLEMIETLLDFARNRFSDRIPLRRESINLRDACRTIIDEISGKWLGRKIRFEADGACVGFWDPGRIKQVISNLVTNALVHGDKASVVEVRLEQVNDGINLNVHNYGKPIPESARANIFDQFYKGAPDAPEGLGLGLFIANRIVQAHQGQITVTSSEEHGTTFRVYLPHISQEQTASRH